ncbi:hypothetical protein, partial [Neisseria gonorrhoeae]|uniref:hypothetical protein n=1 Tax=Neisseria gonorrhoeae TaxID=485 RepID=UPI003FA53B81
CALASIALYRLSFPIAAGGSGSRCTLCTKAHRESMLAIYSGLTKTSTALPRLSSKRTIP